ncbi:T9SS type A sorting domain-containing protein [Adhaeribacter sp. BT258]|uniref:T9SS type A sorting domain-containing protein n=1 Tax=Adhaeribacter terrigena TaxID=2793070 RepID=A0ABS1BXL7_9BACT|nr:peptide-N-glycosidase F-related protein [Adhaeribacter terrigena]MBK0401893.1 T9SS type A sorting domain-containing protein [Adhaeribacter terrigena]
MSGVQAAPGDTTVVQSHTATQLANYGNYNSPAVFPTSNTAYRNITMTFTLGKYQCQGNPQYCGDWDYGVQVFLFTPTDTFEIGRLITPYANVSRFPWNWQHRYEFDVTDYAQYLKGNTNIRIHYSGYSGGFTANVKFTLIEGTPPRNVIKIDRLWNGSFAYGNSAAFEAKMNARTKQIPAGTQAAVLKFNVTGHGSNPADNCSEFCSKYYRVNVNNAMVAQKNIWRNNCGLNNLYPQTGTWVYDRANWCPGDAVQSNYHPLGNLTAGSNYTVDVDFQAYNVSSSQASYAVEGQVIYYGAYHYTTDASLETIISPNDHEAYFRSNPTCEEAKILVKNTGNTTINSLEVTYGLLGGTMHTYPLSVSIPAGGSEELSLPNNSEFVTMGTGKAKFTALISKVNGAADPNALNNEMQTEFTPMAVWPNNFLVTMTTNGAGSQTKWRIYDASGNAVKSRLQTSGNTTYRDTIQLPSGCYRLEVTDTGCNGLSWWAAQSQGTGSLTAKNLANNANLKLKGYFNGDFGCGFTEAFRIQTTLGTQEDKAAFDLSVFPNPAQTILNVKVESKNQIVSLELYNALGQQVSKLEEMSPNIQVPVHHLPAGVYTLKCQVANKFVQKQIVIQK